MPHPRQHESSSDARAATSPLRSAAFAVAVVLGAIAAWLIVTGSTQKDVEIGVLLGLWGLLLASFSIFGTRHPHRPADEPVSGREVDVRGGELDTRESAAARRAYEYRLEEMLRRQIQAAMAAEVAGLRAEVNALRSDFMEQIGPQLRVERIETTRLIGSGLEALQHEVRQVSGRQAGERAADVDAFSVPTINDAAGAPGKAAAAVPAEPDVPARVDAPGVSTLTPAPRGAEPSHEQPPAQPPVAPVPTQEPLRPTPAPIPTGGGEPSFASSMPRRFGSPVPSPVPSPVSSPAAPVASVADDLPPFAPPPAQAPTPLAAAHAASAAAEPAKPEPFTPEPFKSEPFKSEPFTAEPAKPERFTPEPAKASAEPKPAVVSLPSVSQSAPAPLSLPSLSLPSLPLPLLPSAPLPYVPPAPLTFASPAPEPSVAPAPVVQPAPTPAAAPGDDPFADLPRLTRFTDVDAQPLSASAPKASSNGYSSNGSSSNGYSSNGYSSNGSSSNGYSSNGYSSNGYSSNGYSSNGSSSNGTSAGNAAGTGESTPPVVRPRPYDGPLPQQAAGGRRRRDADDSNDMLARILQREGTTRP